MRVLPLMVLILLSAAQAQAGLIIDIVGFAGSGRTTWNFSGSYINTADPRIPTFLIPPSPTHIAPPNLFSLTDPAPFPTAPLLLDGFNLFDNGVGEFLNTMADGDFSTGFSNSGTVLSTATSPTLRTGPKAAPTVTGSVSGAHLIDGIFLNSGPGVGDDDFGWYAQGAFTEEFELLTFSGQGNADIDVTDFFFGLTGQLNTGTRTFQTAGFTPTGTSFDLQINVIAIPEPASMTLMSLACLGGVIGYRRRNRKVNKSA